MTQTQRARGAHVQHQQQTPSGGAGQERFFWLGRPVILVSVGLVAVIALTYGQCCWYGFVNYDDPEYVYNNPHVIGGLTGNNITWAFTEAYAANWHPLTWLSHMCDCELYGLWAGGHHLTNFLLHSAAAVVLFLAFRRMTGDLWPSAFVAAAFALHPLRVESVAWVAERKDVLSGVFFALTLLAYDRYTRKPTGSRYALVAAALALGLLAKQMLVTTPCVLFLLDIWPLRRLAAKGEATGPGVAVAPGDARPRFELRWLLAEKLPLMGLAVAAAAAVIFAQSDDGAMGSLGQYPLPQRISNAIVTYVVYLQQTLLPLDLAVFYPHPGNSLSTVKVLGSVLLLLTITVAAVALRRQQPLLIGWLWYLGTLVPVIGLVQVGAQAHADRYTYIPQIGLWLALAWGVPWSAFLSRRIVAGIATVVLLIWTGLSIHQVGYWRDSVTLLSHSMSCTGPNAMLLPNLGYALDEQGREAEAMSCFHQAIELAPNDAITHYHIGRVLVRRGEDGEAAEHFRIALENDSRATIAISDFVALHIKMGTKDAQEGRLNEAIRHFDIALAKVPDHPVAKRNKAAAYVEIGISAAQSRRVHDAIVAFRAAVQADPKLAIAHDNLGIALMEVEEWEAAANEFRAALRIDPNDPRALANLQKLAQRKHP